jgi:hypothetical protein
MGVLVVDNGGRTLPAPPAARINSPVSSIVSGLPISEEPEIRLLRPVA